MWKTLSVVVSVAVLSVAGLVAAWPVRAATTADVTITVTITNLSVSVTGGPVAFGLVSLGGNTVSGSLAVTNEGNVPETYTVQLTAKDLLTVGETETGATDNTFVLQALFTGDGESGPSSGDFGADDGSDDDVVKFSAPQVASSTVYAWTGSTNGDGSSVPAAEVRDLYLKYSAPTTDSATSGAQEDLTLTVAATAS